MADNVFVIGHEKGGVGKTTGTANIATVLTHFGLRDLLIVNTDQQDSIGAWLADRLKLWGKSVPKIECVSIRGERIDDALLDLAPRYRAVLVDAQGSDNIEFRMALTVAKCAILPMSAERLDTAVLPQVNRIIRTSMHANKGLVAKVLPYKIKAERRDWTWKELRAQLDTLGDDLRLGLCATMVGSRAAFPDAFYDGLGVIEMKKRDSKAVSEAIGMTRELVGKELMEAADAA